MRFMFLMLALLLIAACGKKEVRNEVSEEKQPVELLKYGDQFYAEGDYENAFRAYGIIYYNFPTSREYIDAALGLSKCYGAMENYETEFDILFTLLRENLIPSKVPAVYTSIAGFYERSAGISEQITAESGNDYQKAISYLEKAISYPNSEDVQAKSYAQFKIGTLYEKLGDFEKAIGAYENALNNFPGSEWALRSEQNIGDLRVKLQRRADYQQGGLMPDAPPAEVNPASSLTPAPAETPQDSSNAIPPVDDPFLEPDTSGF